MDKTQPERTPAHIQQEYASHAQRAGNLEFVVRRHQAELIRLYASMEQLEREHVALAALAAAETLGQAENKTRPKKANKK